MKPNARPRYTLAELLAQCDVAAPPPRDEWDNVPDVGLERIGWYDDVGLERIDADDPPAQPPLVGRRP